MTATDTTVGPTSHAATASLEASASSFEQIYASASGQAASIPWHRGAASPALVNWLNAVAPTRVRCGSRIAVVGCGLGYDARELMARGYDVTAFDCSPTAIAWAQRLDPDHAADYHCADLLNPPSRWRHRFDLVVEVNTLQALHPSLRLGAMSALADFLSAHGRLLVIARGAASAPALEDGPPWPLTESELQEATALAQLVPDGGISCFQDGDPPVTRLRAEFVRRP